MNKTQILHEIRNIAMISRFQTYEAKIWMERQQKLDERVKTLIDTVALNLTAEEDIHG